MVKTKDEHLQRQTHNKEDKTLMHVKGKHTQHTVPTQGIEGTLLSPDDAQCLKPQATTNVAV
jgi:hypothetical protein